MFSLRKAKHNPHVLASVGAVIVTLAMLSVLPVLIKADEAQRQLLLNEATAELENAMAFQVSRVQSAMQLVAGMKISLEHIYQLTTDLDHGEREALNRQALSLFSDIMRLDVDIDHARIVDIDGYEQARMNRDGAVVTAVTPDKLQFKGDRDYYAAVKALLPLGMYVGDISLNVENGVFEIPHKPVRRFGVALRDGQNTVIAYLIVNYRFDNVELDTSQQALSEIFIVNGQGELVDGGRSYSDWRFAKTLGLPDKTLADINEDVAVALRNVNTDEVWADEGLYRYRSNADFAFKSPSFSVLTEDTHVIHVVQFLPLSYLNAGRLLSLDASSPVLRLLLLTYLALMYVIFRFAREVNNSRQLALAAEDARDQARKAYRLLREEEMRQKNLLSVISHELRTPIASIAMLAETAGDAWTAGRQDVVKLVSHVTTLMDDLRLVARPEEPPPVRYEESELSEILRASITHNAPLISAGSMAVTLDDQIFEGTVIGVDRFRLTGVLSNLVKNACIHSRGNQLWIDADLEKTALGQDRLIVRIEDDGRGIPDDRKADIFEAFSRIDDHAPGMGLGLFIVKSWIEEIDGTVTVFDSKHGGAGFKVMVPIHLIGQRPAAGASLAPASLASTSLAPTSSANNAMGVLQECRVLLVEDDQIMRRLTESVLRDLGGIVSTAIDGRQALAMIGDAQFDLVLTDYFMPNMNGVQLISTLRQQNNTVPIIAVTAATIGEERDQLIAAGADAVMAKPISRVELARVVASVFAGGLSGDKC